MTETAKKLYNIVTTYYVVNKEFPQYRYIVSLLNNEDYKKSESILRILALKGLLK